MKFSTTLAISVASIISTKFYSAEGSGDGIILIEDFSSPRLQWSQVNDPVMGGESTGTFEIKDGLGRMKGEVVDVPKLSAPGFIKAGAYGDFPDVSSCDKLKLTVKTKDKVAYAGYRMGFGLKAPPNSMPYTHGFKAHFDAPEGDDFEEVIIPFNEFSDNWSPYTGDQTITCAENSIYCPDDETLTNMHELSLMAEGVGGEVDLIIKTIHAIGCDVNIVASFPNVGNKGKGNKQQTFVVGICMFCAISTVILVGLFMKVKKERNTKKCSNIPNIPDSSAFKDSVVKEVV